MLITILGVPVVLFASLIAVLCRKSRLAKLIAGGLAIWLLFYTVLLFGSSLISKEKVLAVNEPKAYCGFYFDCHLHAVVTKVETADHYLRHKAKGKFYGVVVQVFSDARNPNVRFHLHDPEMVIIDSQGNRFERNERVEDELYSQPAYLGADIAGDQKLEKELVFDIPATSTGLKMEIIEGHPAAKFFEYYLIGDEDSVWHKHTYFDIQEQNDNAGL